jgi:hypothetical protein
MDPAECLALFRAETARIADVGHPADYPASTAAAIRLSADALAARCPAALALVELCAGLSPDGVPLALLTDHTDTLDGPLANALADPESLASLVGEVNRSSLAQIDGGTLVMHRLVRAVVSDRMDTDHRAAQQEHAHALLAVADPGDTGPAAWPAWRALLPHTRNRLGPAGKPAVAAERKGGARRVLRRSPSRPSSRVPHVPRSGAVGACASYVLHVTCPAHVMGPAAW